MSMNPFEFRTVASIAVQWGGARALGESLAARFSARSALLITDKGLVSAGLIAPVLASLEGSAFASRCSTAWWPIRRSRLSTPAPG